MYMYSTDLVGCRDQRVASTAVGNYRPFHGPHDRLTASHRALSPPQTSRAMWPNVVKEMGQKPRTHSFSEFLGCGSETLEQSSRLTAAA